MDGVFFLKAKGFLLPASNIKENFISHNENSCMDNIGPQYIFVHCFLEVSQKLCQSQT